MDRQIYGEVTQVDWLKSFGKILEEIVAKILAADSQIHEN